MIRRGIFSALAGLLLTVTNISVLRADTPAEPPDFKEVYELIRAHAAGLSQPQLDHAAVQALVSALAPKVMLVSGDNQPTNASQPLLSKTNLYEGEIGYLRVGRVGNGLPEAVRKGYEALAGTNKLKGVVLDLRYAAGTDYAGAAGVADLFVTKERPLLNWGSGMVKAKEKTDALTVPVAVLVNHQTSGAAEALAALLRETGTGLVIGNRTAGQAMIAEDFPLKNGERLRIATAPIQVGDSTTLSAEGVNPDIPVRVSADDERAYYADAFRSFETTNLFSSAGLSLGNQGSTTNRTRRARFNEAELIRERREGPLLDTDVSRPRESELEKPVVHDPALARALDLLKGLAVVRHSRS